MSNQGFRVMWRSWRKPLHIIQARTITQARQLLVTKPVRRIIKAAWLEALPPDFDPVLHWKDFFVVHDTDNRCPRCQWGLVTNYRGIANVCFHCGYRKLVGIEPGSYGEMFIVKYNHDDAVDITRNVCISTKRGLAFFYYMRRRYPVKYDNPKKRLTSIKLLMKAAYKIPKYESIFAEIERIIKLIETPVKDRIKS